MNPCRVSLVTPTVAATTTTTVTTVTVATLGNLARYHLIRQLGGTFLGSGHLALTLGGGGHSDGHSTADGHSDGHSTAAATQTATRLQRPLRRTLDCRRPLDCSISVRTAYNDTLLAPPGPNHPRAHRIATPDPAWRVAGRPFNGRARRSPIYLGAARGSAPRTDLRPLHPPHP